MFGASALYHRGNWSLTTARRLLQLDHTAIFLLIAGTYTPIALLAMSDTMQVATLAAVWLVALAGIVFEWLPIPAPRGYVTSVYLGLGWIGAFAFIPLSRETGWWGVGLVAGGGLCYMVGAIVHAARKPDPWPEVFGYHEIFHAFVILAALLQYCAIRSSSSHSSSCAHPWSTTNDTTAPSGTRTPTTTRPSTRPTSRPAPRGVGRVAHPGRRAAGAR